MNDAVDDVRLVQQREIDALVATRVAPEAQATVRAFVTRYYAQVDPEDLQERLPADLYGAALSHLNFARRRELGNARVRAFNVWPGECGAPRLLGASLATPCVTLYGIDASGVAHAGEEVCAVYPGEGDDLPLPRPAPAGTPGVVLPPASASGDESEGESAAGAMAAPSAASAACGVVPARAPRGAVWILLLGALGWRFRRPRAT